LAFDRQFNLYASNYGDPSGSNNRITKFTATGVELFHGPDQFFGVAVDVAGNVYAADHFNNRVLKYSPAGVLLGPLVVTGSGGNTPRPYDLKFDRMGNLYVANLGGNGPYNGVHKFGPNGEDLGIFAYLYTARGIAFDPEGNLYVIDGTYRILKYSPSGAALGVFATLSKPATFMAFKAPEPSSVLLCLLAVSLGGAALLPEGLLVSVAGRRTMARS
jgi:DNA-binding beta-propeller fold protein YncE